MPRLFFLKNISENSILLNLLDSHFPLKFILKWIFEVKKLSDDFKGFGQN